MIIHRLPVWNAAPWCGRSIVGSQAMAGRPRYAGGAFAGLVDAYPRPVGARTRGAR